MKYSAIFLAALACCPAVQAADHDQHQQHHTHLTSSPAGVMADHVHAKGSWMFSYTWMHMRMDGMRDGTSGVSDGKVLKKYMVTPENMDTDMHMFGAMYAVNDDFTLMAMAPWIKKSMQHKTRMGKRFTTGSEGVGDVKLSGIYALSNRGNHQVLVNFGVSAPSGDINEKDNTPAMKNARLPYPMQLGSGTWDLLPGLTWTLSRGAHSWGAQTQGTVRLGDNDNNYSFGDRIEVSGWGAYRFLPSWSASLRLKGQAWGDVDGNDRQLNKNVVPTADNDLQGGQRIDFLAGVNFYAPAGVFSGNRLALEGGIPVYENLDGPQMSTDWMLTANWQMVF